MSEMSPTTPLARFLFVIWEKARWLEPQLLEAIAARFRVIKSREITWPQRHFTSNLAAFYGWKGRFCWWNKARRCGRGPFLAIEVDDPEPRWVSGSDMSGHGLVLNANVSEAKRTMRAMTGHSNRVHASVTREETAHELAALASADESGRIPFAPLAYTKSPSGRVAQVLHIMTWKWHMNKLRRFLSA